MTFEILFYFWPKKRYNSKSPSFLSPLNFTVNQRSKLTTTELFQWLIRYTISHFKKLRGNKEIAPAHFSNLHFTHNKKLELKVKSQKVKKKEWASWDFCSNKTTQHLFYTCTNSYFYDCSRIFFSFWNSVNANRCLFFLRRVGCYLNFYDPFFILWKLLIRVSQYNNHPLWHQQW